jgi:hypothetical protein
MVSSTVSTELTACMAIRRAFWTVSSFSVLRVRFGISPSVARNERGVKPCKFQIDPLPQKQHGIEDSLAIMERWTRDRGALVGVDYGEGYRRYAGHPYPETPVLEELLGSKAIIHDRQWGSAR